MKKGNWKQILLILGLIVLFSANLHSQYFLTGQDPNATKWKQIKADHFRVIYPDNYSKMAEYYLNVLTLTAIPNNSDYQAKTRMIPVILHNQTSTANAMAPIAPMRIEMFEMPPQDIYPQIWQDQLALHEYRHSLQQFKLQQGLTKGLYYVFGQQGVAAVMGLWVPFWYIEGDAVYVETIYSNSGRGRVPDFIYPLTAQLLDKKIYKYDKAVFGSYKDFVPNHYMLGYQLVARGTDRFGFEMWDKTLDRVARRPYYLVPFTTSIKKHTGKYKVRFYKDEMQKLKNETWITDRATSYDSVTIVPTNDRFFTNYLFINLLNDGSLISERAGLDDINRFVHIAPDGKTKKIFTPGYDLKESLSVSDDLICWNEKGYDPRWSMRSYSNIKLYNYKTGKLSKLTKRTRYFAPSLSNSQQYIATVYISNESVYAIHVLDATNGDQIKEFKTDENLFFMNPRWSEDDSFIVSMVLGKQGKNIVLIDVETGQMEYLLPFSFTEIKQAVMYGDWIVYSGAYEGRDNLYAIHRITKKTYKLLGARFGATGSNFSKDGKMVYFSYYTSDGYKPAYVDFDPDELQAFDISITHHEYLADRLVYDNTFNLDDTIVPSKEYESKKYSKAAHLFNIHSWAPLSVDVDNYTINPGVTVMSQNDLSTSVTSLSYLYDVNEQTNKISFGFDYYGWYPVVGFNIDYGGRRQTISDSTGPVNLRWTETDLSLKLSVPLNFTSSKWVKGMQPSVSITQKFLNMSEGSKYQFKEDRLTIPLYRLYAYNQLKTSPKDIYPKWGQSFDLMFRNTPLSETVSSQTALIGWFYFPGILRHQGIRIYGGYQQTDGTYSFSNLAAIPRGYTNINYPEYFTLRSDYAFPIAYPDWNVPGAFYLKRIYSKVFYDYLRGTDTDQIDELSSTGFELYTDWHFLSILVNFRLGLRMSYRIEEQSQKYELLFGITY